MIKISLIEGEVKSRETVFQRPTLLNPYPYYLEFRLLSKKKKVIDFSFLLVYSGDT